MWRLVKDPVVPGLWDVILDGSVYEVYEYPVFPVEARWSLARDESLTVPENSASPSFLIKAVYQEVAELS